MIGLCKPGSDGLIRQWGMPVAVAWALSLLLGACPVGAEEKESGQVETASQSSSLFFDRANANGAG